MKKTYYLFAVLLAVVVYVATAYALTAEEMLLLKRGGISDEKILEIQKKEGFAPAPKINHFDWNEDGKKDIIAGSSRLGFSAMKGRVDVYLNKGTNLQPIFDKPTEIYGIEITRGAFDQYDIVPYVVDWNNDGKKDLITGEVSGEISLFININNNKKPIFAPEVKLNEGDIDVGSSSSPAMVDWNGDSKKDLVVGNQKGEVYVFLNIGEDYAPEFQSTGIKTEIKVPAYARPFIVDWNNDGKFDIISGSSEGAWGFKGKVYIFINEGDSKNPKFGKAETLQVNNKELILPNNTSIVALDWNDDAKTDILVSNQYRTKHDPSTGKEDIIPLGIYLLLNTGTKEKPEFKELKEIKGKFRDDTVL